MILGDNYLNAGVAFPSGMGSGNTADLFWRTDRGILYYYDGTRWLSVQEFTITAGAYTALGGNAYAATTTPIDIQPIPGDVGATQVYLTGISSTWFVNAGGTALSAGVHDWTIGIADGAGTTFASFNITAFSTASSAWKNGRAGMGGPYARTIATDVHWRINLIKIGTPGSIIVPKPLIHYRLIG